MASSKGLMISSTGQGEVEARRRQGLGRVEITQDQVFSLVFTSR